MTEEWNPKSLICCKKETKILASHALFFPDRLTWSLVLVTDCIHIEPYLQSMINHVDSKAVRNLGLTNRSNYGMQWFR